MFVLESGIKALYHLKQASASLSMGLGDRTVGVIVPRPDAMMRDSSCCIMSLA
jgi:hypothetical protein